MCSMCRVTNTPARTSGLELTMSDPNELPHDFREYHVANIIYGPQGLNQKWWCLWVAAGWFVSVVSLTYACGPQSLNWIWLMPMSCRTTRRMVFSYMALSFKALRGNDWQKSPIFQQKRPIYSDQKSSIVFSYAVSVWRRCVVTKEPYIPIKRAQFFDYRALYSHKKSPIFCSCTVLYLKALRGIGWQKSRTFQQKSLIFQQKSPVFQQKSPIFQQKSPIFEQYL